MTMLQDRLTQAVADVEHARDTVVAEAAVLTTIAQGPATGTGSLVTTTHGDVRTAARAISELADGSAYASKDLANVTGILGQAHGGSGGADFTGAVSTALASSFAALAHANNVANGPSIREDLGINIVVLSATQATPPTSPTNGDKYLIPSSPVGAWVGHTGIAKWVAGSSSWTFDAGVIGYTVWAADTNTFYELDAQGWTALQPGSGSMPAYADLNATPVGLAKVNGHGGGRFRAHWTADRRIVVYGDVSAFEYDFAGDNWSPYTIATNHLGWPSSVQIEALYAGQNYILIQTNEAAGGNLYHLGASDYGQNGINTTRSNIVTKTPVTARVVSVVTEASVGPVEKFWFALTSAGQVIAAGSKINGAQADGTTSGTATAHTVTLADGITPLSGVAEVTCCNVHTPVWARMADGTAYRWGAATSGAHASGETTPTVITRPSILGGSSTPTTGIARMLVTGNNFRAVSLMLTAAGKLKVAGDRYYGAGDGAALAAAAESSFDDITGALAAQTVSRIFIGGGEYYNLAALDTAGQFWLCGYMASQGLFGDGVSTNRATFGKPVIPELQGSITGLIISGGASFTAIYVMAIVLGAHKIFSIGYDAHFQTGKKLISTLPANQLYGYVLNAPDRVSVVQSVGEYQVFGLEILTSDGEIYYCGANDQGQGGTQTGNVHAVDSLQLCRPLSTRLIKPPTLHADAAWTLTTSYTRNDLVQLNGSTWACIAATSLNVSPPTLPTTVNAHWKLFAAKGDAGPAGVGGGTVTAAGITDASAAGQALITAANVAAQRTALGLAAVAETGAYANLTGLPPITMTAAYTIAGNSAGARYGTTLTAASGTFIGVSAGANITTSVATLVGHQAGMAATTAPQLTAFGTTACLNVTTGGQNTGIGFEALKTVTTGGLNTAVGALAGSRAAGTSNHNTSVGYASGYGNGMGSGNTNVGSSAGQQLGALAVNNTNVGYLAGQNISSGTGNMTFGYLAGNAITTGSGNTCIGTNAGITLGATNYAIYIGNAAGQGATASGIGIGQASLLANAGLNNIGIGRQTGNKISSGHDNIAIGDAALANSLVGSNCIAIGSNVLGVYADAARIDGLPQYLCNSIGIGSQVLGQCSTGFENVGIGTSVFTSLTSGYENTAVGIEAMSGVTVGHRSVAMGVAAMKRGTTAYQCVAIGYGAGDGDGTKSNISGHDNTYIGYGCTNASATQRNFQTIIGASVFGVDADNAITLGRIGTDAVYMGDAFIGLKSNTVNAWLVAELPAPAAANKYMERTVSDALAPVWGSAVTGGGSVIVRVMSTSSAWVCI